MPVPVGRALRGAPTLKQRQIYLEAIGRGLSKTLAAQAAGRDRHAFKRLRIADEDFAVAELDACEGRNDALIDEMWRRGHDGVEDVKWVGPPATGREVVFKHHSDKLIELLAKAWMPNLFRDRATLEHTGAGGGPVKTEVQITDDDARSAYHALVEAGLVQPGPAALADPEG